MATPHLDPRVGDEIIAAAPGCQYYKDIAERLGVPRKTLMSRISALGISTLR